MRQYTYIWISGALLILTAQAASATQGATALWDNVVCMSLPVYVISLLLPAEDIVGILGKKFGLSDDNNQ